MGANEIPSSESGLEHSGLPAVVENQLLNWLH